MILIWVGFFIFVLFLLALDLGVLHRKAHIVSMKEALLMSGVWISLGLLFSVFVYYGYENHWLGLGSIIDSVDFTINDGKSATIKYITGISTRVRNVAKLNPKTIVHDNSPKNFTLSPPNHI